MAAKKATSSSGSTALICKVDDFLNSIFKNCSHTKTNSYTTLVG